MKCFVTNFFRSSLPLVRSRTEKTHQQSPSADNILQRRSPKSRRQSKTNRLARVLGRLSLAVSLRPLHLHLLLKSKHLPQRKLRTATEEHRIHHIVLQCSGNSVRSSDGFHHKNILSRRYKLPQAIAAFLLCSDGVFLLAVFRPECGRVCDDFDTARGGLDGDSDSVHGVYTVEAAQSGEGVHFGGDE